TGEFPRIFASAVSDMKLKDRITLTPSKVVNPIIADGKILNIDKPGEIEHKGTIEVQLNAAELQQRFDNFISQNVSPYAPADSSDRMKTAIYQFFSEKCEMEKLDPQVQRVVLGKENVQPMVDAINLAKERYEQ